MQRDKIFISYSHADKRYFERLLVHLRALNGFSEKSVKVWTDREIHVGDEWRVQIDSALKEAAVAILLISADFLASDFVRRHELPPILAACEKEGTRIVCVVVSPSPFEQVTELSRYQCVNAPSVPLTAMTHNAREELYTKTARIAVDALRKWAEKTQLPLEGVPENTKDASGAASTSSVEKALPSLVCNAAKSMRVWNQLVSIVPLLCVPGAEPIALLMQYYYKHKNKNLRGPAPSDNKKERSSPKTQDNE